MTVNLDSGERLNEYLMKKKYAYIIVLLLTFSCLAAFGQIAGNEFINFDDNRYITENNFIQGGFTCSSVKWAFTDRLSTHWHPLTWLSHMLDWRLFGNSPAGHHLMNLLFHIGAVIFLFLFLFKTTNNLWPAAFAAAFFALHPLRVESVAWAAERKDVLSMFFGMTALYAYAYYLENFKRSRYLLCLFLFALALLSKSMLISLPFILLLMDYWPLQRFQAISASGMRAAKILLKEKIPFFVLSIASGIAALWALYESAETHLDFPARVLNAIVSYATYLKKLFLPFDLAVIYPFAHSFPTWQIMSSVALLLGITAVVIYFFRKLPFLSVGWFWYLGALIPVSGLVSINVPMADRYTYLPSIGISIMLAWGIPALIKDERLRRKILFPVALAFLLMLSVVTFHQCGHWKNSVSIFSRTLEVTENNYMAHNNLAVALTEEGIISEALEHYNKAMAIKPELDLFYYNLGVSYVKTGQYQLAIGTYSKAINLNPRNFKAYNNRGIVYAELGRYQEAMEDFNTAISLNKYFADAYHNRSLTLFNERKREPGCADARKACELGNCGALGLARDRGLCP
jgi:tetratricopeptide (TPR) repeat protein